MTLQDFGESGRHGADAHITAVEHKEERECAALEPVAVVVASKTESVMNIVLQVNYILWILLWILSYKTYIVIKLN